MTKFEQAQIERAKPHGRSALLRTVAIIHRAGSKRTQREILELIKDLGAGSSGELTVRNGCLMYVGEWIMNKHALHYIELNPAPLNEGPSDLAIIAGAAALVAGLGLILVVLFSL
jgi:hypothetical protein